MSGQFDAQYLISTAQTVTNLNNVSTAAKALDAALASLDKAAKDNSASIASIATAMAGVVQMERDAAAAVKERAAATLAASKADAQEIANATKVAESASRVAVNEAKVGTESAKTAAIVTKSETDKAVKIEATTAAIERNNKVTDASIERAGKLNDSRVNNTNNAGANALVESNGRLATSEQRTATAAIQTEAAQARLNTTQERGAKSTLELNDNLSNSRYLLYDVGATYRGLALAMLAIPAATTAVAASYEKDFAQVLRTTSGESSAVVLKLRDDLKALGSQIPLTFGELSNIASLGAQLGLAANQLASFTDTVAKFVATTNVGVDEAATAFGRLRTSFAEQYQADPAGFFNKIGSTISELGVASVATDTEIVNIINQLSPLGAVAGFSAQGIAGLSAALASVRIRPELARGSFQRIISEITSSASQGSVAMQNYAKYMGMTGDQALALQKSDPQQFFTSLITGLGKGLKQGVPFTTMLDDIGVKSVRDKQFVLALANNTDVLTSSMDLANKSYADGSFLNKSAEPVFTTLAATVRILSTDLANLADTLGGPMLHPMADFIRLISGAVSGIDDFIKANRGVGAAVSALMGISAVVGVALALKSAMAFALAGMVAFQQVAAKTGIATAMTAGGGMTQLSTTMLMMKGATREATTELIANNGALRALGASSAQIAAANEAVAASLTAEGIAAKATAVANGELAASTVATTLSGSRMGGVFKSVGSGLLSLVGGPIGIAIGAIALLGSTFLNSAAQAKQAGEAIATAMQQGADAGSGAIADSLNKQTVGPGTLTGNSVLTDWGKSMRELGDQAGVSMDQMVAAVSKGKGAGDALTKTLDAIAVAKGHASFADWNATIGSHSGSFDTQLNNLKDIKAAVESLGNSYAGGKANLDAVTAASANGADATKNMTAAQTAAAQAAQDHADQLAKLGDAMKKVIEDEFGFVDLESAVQASLQKLGEDLQKGGNDFSVYSAAGRDNLKNLKDAFATEGAKLGNDVANMLLTPQQAAAQYSKYVDDVLKQLAAKGVNPAQIAALATAVKSDFAQNLDMGPAPTLKVGAKVDTPKASAEVLAAMKYLQNIAYKFGTLDVKLLAKMDGGPQVIKEVNAMQGVVHAATGKPYAVTVDAVTGKAVEDVSNTQKYVLDVASGKYVLQVNADTTAALGAGHDLAVFWGGLMNWIIDGLNTADNAMSVITGQGGGNQLHHVGWGEAAPAQRTTAPVAQKATPTPPTSTLTIGGSGGGTGAAASTNVGGIASGYNDAAAAAAKAGKTGTAANKAIAASAKNAANGISDLTAATNDYASRLKTGLQSAFDQQYGLQTATDAYYTALNAITKKRKDDLQSIKDAIVAQKQLNDEKNGFLVDANKAGIEKGISVKYGETARAADYGNQQKTALDNAAAKQKDITANIASQKTLKDGIGALTGYSDAAIANRAALRDLESKSLDMISAYAATGKSQDQVATYTANLTKQFGTQVGQMGFNRTSVANLQGALSRYVAVVNSVPTRVTTAVSAPGATSGGGTGGGAAGDLGAVATAAHRIPTNVGVQVQIQYLPVNDSFGALKGYREVKNGVTQHGVQLAYAAGGQVRGYADGGLIPGHGPASGADNLMASVDGKGLIKVRSKEYIVSQPAVDYWGTDFMNSINKMQMPHFNMGGSVGRSSGGGSAGLSVVSLDAESLSLLAKLADKKVTLYVDQRELASTVNGGNKILASEGRN